MTSGILLVNLGTPASADTADVRRYLGEFLMDGHVLDVPWALRKLIVSGFILPFRPKRSAHAYARIWDAAGPGTGSPLLHHGRACRDALAARLNSPTALAMRYGQPGIADAINDLLGQGVDELLLVPLYPQHADSTRTTTIEAVRSAAPATMRVRLVAPFFAHPAYIDAQSELIRQHLPERWDHLLLSYHGLPERHITRADPTAGHCLKVENCCEIPSPAHATCYRHQCYETSRLLAQRLDMKPADWTVSFQSRLGRMPWLAPYTDEMLTQLPGRGVRHLVVACPAFVADNLETLEEIGLTGRDIFLQAGGESFTLVPCLNAASAWIQCLATLIAECAAD